MYVMGDILKGKPPYNLISAVGGKISFIYFEYGFIIRDDNSLIFRQGGYEYDIPAASLAFILLGPGTSITQPAMAELARWGCSVSFVNGGGLGIHSSYVSTSATSADLIVKQAAIVSSKELRLSSARLMYSIRWGNENVPRSYNVSKLMLLEGRRVKKLYAEQAKIYNFDGFRRKNRPAPEERFSNVNEILTASNYLLYGLVNAVILNLGLSPRLGVIHHGHANSFTFDIADLYKESFTIPMSFKLAAEGGDVSSVRRMFRERSFDYNMIPRIIEDIYLCLNFDPFQLDEEESSMLWDGSKALDTGGYSLG